MYDKLEIIGQSTFQHGKYNDRIYLLDLHPNDITTIFSRFKALISNHNYSKIIAKVPEKYEHYFLKKGYTKEAMVPNFYYGKENMLFLAKYLEKKRRVDHDEIKAKKVLKIALNKKRIKEIKLKKHYHYEQLTEEHVKQMTSLYEKVFKTYPFPIFEEKYIIETMRDNVIYFGVFKQDKLIGISSCEMNQEKSYVEMTDFAILEKYRGQKISLYLLKVMEEYMKTLKIQKAYTMARALSYGMNIAFSKMGYKYSGTVINNANISGDIESLNIWHKDL